MIKSDSFSRAKEMCSETFAKFCLISLHVLFVHLIDGVHSQAQVSIPSDWLQESQDYINRELKLQQDLMREHAANLWKISHPEDKGKPTPAPTPKPHHDIEVVVATPTPSLVVPKPTTTKEPTYETPRPPQPYEEDNFVDLRNTCLRAKTEVWEKGSDGRWKKRKGLCRDREVYKDEFSGGPRVDNTKWSHEVRMPGEDTYHGFVTYLESVENSYVKDNMLFIKPTVLDDRTVRTGHRFLENCTGRLGSEECDRRGRGFQFLPPVNSALLTTKNIMAFKYGKIEIRAKLPIGDWIVPEITLEPRRTETYGELKSGRIRIALAKGNRHLTKETKEVGNSILEQGFEVGSSPPRKVTRETADGWGNAFHNYTLIWTPDNLKFQVDDGTPEPLCTPGHPLYKTLGIRIGKQNAAIWERATNIAPFDKEFYISLGLTVGGLDHFPDDVGNSEQRKPWGNYDTKLLSTFWENRADWMKSWEENNSTMIVDYVRITSV
ncbi:hypothetical protein GE061_010836 [Apolygus lucorum]|uniref:GH16 domain-containing protein n=1 Tax=Apolygus lucorum TaxID=248454 RepID=A0A8S9XXV8_APOLU|nr:hypothetical protein GE061_010836 [Apolygus lucorum]